MLLRSLLFAIGICFATSITTIAQTSPFHPALSKSISKRGGLVCAGFGTSAIEFDAATIGDIKIIDVSSEVVNVFPIEDDSWGIISKGGIYRWTPKKNKLAQLYSGDSGFSLGAYYQGKIYLAKKDTIFSLSNGETAKVTNIFGDIKNFGFIGDDLIVFGNGTWIISLTDSKSRASSLFKSFWGSDGIVNPYSKEFAVGGGGWPGIIVKWQTPRSVSMLERKSHSTYDHIAGWDIDSEGEYWLTARLAGEGAVENGRNIFQSYPGQAIIYPPPVMHNGFVVNAGKLFLSTIHGVLIINTESGDVSILTYPPLVKSFFEQVEKDLNLRARITYSLNETDGGWIGGELHDGHWNKASFLLFSNGKQTQYYDLPINGLRQLVRYNDQLLISGQAIDTWEGGEFEESGGLVAFNIKTHETHTLYTEPISRMRVEGNQAYLEAYLSLGDSERICYRVKAINYDLRAWKEISSTSTIICEEGGAPYDKSEPFVVNTSRVKEIAQFKQTMWNTESIGFGSTAANNMMKPILLPLELTASIEKEEITATPTSFENPGNPLK